MSGHGLAKRKVPLALLLLLAPGFACRRERATLEQCQEILDRIVQLEMRESGFRDPVLLQRRREEFHTLLAPELKECEGKRMRSEVLACVKGASSSEEISHHCLR